MWPRRIFVFLIGVFVGLFDATVAPWFPGSLTAIRLALPLVIVLAAFSSLERALTAALAAGIVMDILQPSFGMVTVRFALTVLIINAVSQRYLTNRSILGSCALGFAGLLVDRILLVIFTWGRSWLDNSFVTEVRPPLVAEVVWTMAVMVATFLLFAAFTKRFMPLLTKR